jgi:hypothetical protein
MCSFAAYYIPNTPPKIKNFFAADGKKRPAEAAFPVRADMV